MALGRANPYEMLAEMPGWLVDEWRIYSQFEPIPTAKRFELMIAKLMALTVNLHLKKGKKPLTAKEFMPDYKPPRRAKPVRSEKLFSMFRDWAILAGARVKD